jgi:hypothetical protein
MEKSQDQVLQCPMRDVESAMGSMVPVDQEAERSYGNIQL